VRLDVLIHGQLRTFRDSIAEEQREHEHQHEHESDHYPECGKDFRPTIHLTPELSPRRGLPAPFDESHYVDGGAPIRLLRIGGHQTSIIQ
jgi:hypothetical protein